MAVATTRPAHVPGLSITLVSASALAYEILLMRLFSISQWHHFAYMIISLALLGFGASGTFLSLAGPRLMTRFRLAYLGNIMLFAIATLACYWLARHVSFNAEEVLWDTRQAFKLLALYLLLCLPFFFAANVIALALSRYTAHITRVYAADLLGAGLGSLGIVLLLFVFDPGMSLRIVSALALAALALGAWELRDVSRPAASLRKFWPALLPVLPLLVPAAWVAPVISPYKGLEQTLRIGGTRVIAERSSPLGLLSVVESTRVPLRHAPGLSIHARGEPPAQLAVFTDGDGMTAITHDQGKRGDFAYLDQLTWALPYHLRPPESVLVLGAGGGSDVQQALYLGASHVDAVELNPQMASLLREDYAAFAGNLYARDDVTLHIAEARGFVAASDESYDLIQVAMLDSFSASSAGLYALSESYVYTVEAIQEYLAHLNPDGYLSLSRWIKLPPRDTVKLLATAIEALRRSGVDAPARRLILIRGWQTSTLLIKNGEIGGDEIAALGEFTKARGFDTAWFPGMSATQANRRNILPQPWFHDAAVALLGDQSERFFNDYKFDVRPSSDDRPYFFKFFKWEVLPEILSLRGKGGLSLLESGYLVLSATLIQAALVSMVLILLPLWYFRRNSQASPTSASRMRVLVYFFAIGLAFLFLEIAFIHKFILLLSHPLYAVAVVLTAFLIFAGLGSGYAHRLRTRWGARRVVTGAVLAIGSLGMLYALAAGTLFAPLMSLPDVAKVAICISLLAPLAFAMGMPFPLAMSELGKTQAGLIPWAWAVNGCASVLSAVLATLLAVHFGFTAVVLLGLVLYAVAATVFPRQ